MPTSRRAAVVGLAVACLLGGASAAMYQGRDLGSTEVDEAMLNVDRTVSGLKCEVPGAIEILKTQQMIIPEATCETVKNADGTDKVDDKGNPVKRSKYVNMFGYKNYKGESYDGQCDFFGGSPPLPEGLGWFIVLGCGTIFAVLTSGMVWFSNKHIPESERTGNNSETFSAAGRTITAGLTAADVVSKWTWAATLLQSSNVAYKFGVSGPFWYAAGATVQIILFAIVAIEIKRKCPAIHTMLEVVQVRWGTAAHLTFLWFGMLSSLIVTAMLILGGSATVNALTGMDIYAASFLIPIAVVGYTAFGGLKGTYYASFTHTFIIYLVLVISLWTAYTGHADLGSADKMYDHLSCAAERVRGIKGYPTATNSNTSFLTFKSGGGLIFGIANVVGNFGTVFADQSYWQGAIACKASATWKGYLLGGVAWFAIPFCMATTFGLAGRALDLPITITEAGNGLVPPAVGTHLMGEAGSFLIALQLFMAVTSTANSEQLAISSLYAYDVYKRYINPQATGKQIILQSRFAIAFWAVFSGIIATILKELGIGLGWVYMMMGCCIGCAVMPITFALCWKDCTAMGAIVGAWAGMISAFIGWFGFAAGANDGVITVATLGQDYPLVTGNLLSLCVSPLMAVGISLAQGGQNFDWALLENASSDYMVEQDKHAKLKETGGEDSKEAMDRAMWITLRVGFGFSLILIPIWPLLALPQDPFTKSYFVFYVALSFIWGHIAMGITTFIPIYEYLYPDPEDTVTEEGKPDAPAPAAPEEQVAGFYMPPAGAQPVPMQAMPAAPMMQQPMMQQQPMMMQQQPMMMQQQPMMMQQQPMMMQQQPMMQQMPVVQQTMIGTA